MNVTVILSALPIVIILAYLVFLDIKRRKNGDDGMIYSLCGNFLAIIALLMGGNLIADATPSNGLSSRILIILIFLSPTAILPILFLLKLSTKLYKEFESEQKSIGFFRKFNNLLSQILFYAVILGLVTGIFIFIFSFSKN